MSEICFFSYQALYNNKYILWFKWESSPSHNFEWHRRRFIVSEQQILRKQYLVRGPDCNLTLNTTNATTRSRYGTVFLSSLYANDSSKSASVLSLVTPKLGKITGYKESITEDIIADFCIDGPLANQLRAQSALAQQEIDVLAGLDCANMLIETIAADDIRLFHSPLHPHLQVKWQNGNTRWLLNEMMYESWLAESNPRCRWLWWSTQQATCVSCNWSGTHTWC